MIKMKIDIAVAEGFNTATTVEMAFAEIFQDLISHERYLPIPLSAWDLNRETILKIPLDCDQSKPLFMHIATQDGEKKRDFKCSKRNIKIDFRAPDQKILATWLQYTRNGRGLI